MKCGSLAVGHYLRIQTAIRTKEPQVSLGFLCSRRQTNHRVDVSNCLHLFTQIVLDCTDIVAKVKITYSAYTIGVFYRADNFDRSFIKLTVFLLILLLQTLYTSGALFLLPKNLWRLAMNQRHCIHGALVIFVSVSIFAPFKN